MQQRCLFNLTSWGECLNFAIFKTTDLRCEFRRCGALNEPLVQTFARPYLCTIQTTYSQISPCHGRHTYGVTGSPDTHAHCTRHAARLTELATGDDKRDALLERGRQPLDTTSAPAAIMGDDDDRSNHKTKYRVDTMTRKLRAHTELRRASRGCAHTHISDRCTVFDTTAEATARHRHTHARSL